MKKSTLQTGLRYWFFTMILIVLFSCSKESSSEDMQSSQQENFIGLSLAKEIGGEVKFKLNTNLQTNKSTVYKPINKKIETIDQVRNDDGQIVFYVINYIEGGYIILSADNRAQPIIGFSDEDRFSVENKDIATYSLGLTSWIANSKKQITSIQKSKARQTNNGRLIWEQVSEVLVSRNLLQQAPSDKCYNRVTTDTKEPLLRVFWDQNNGFNNAMPYVNCDGSSKRALAGCVPIAMAQVMKHYEYPIRYNWSFMEIGSSTDAAADFILDVNKAITNMYPGQPTYSCNGTGVSNNCGYGKGLKS